MKKKQKNPTPKTPKPTANQKQRNKPNALYLASS